MSFLIGESLTAICTFLKEICIHLLLLLLFLLISLFVNEEIGALRKHSVFDAAAYVAAEISLLVLVDPARSKCCCCSIGVVVDRQRATKVCATTQEVRRREREREK